MKVKTKITYNAAKLAKAMPKIIENYILQESEEFEVEETENTIGILNRYIDESEFEGDKTLIKGILQQIYSEACEVE